MSWNPTHSRAWHAADWQKGPFRLPHGDDKEFIPLDKPPEAPSL